MNEPSEVDKKQQKDRLKAAAKLNPVSAKVSPGTHTLIDLLLTGFHQEKIDEKITDLLNQSLQNFLKTKPEFIPLFVAGALWINFGVGEALNKKKLVEDRKNLKVYEASGILNEASYGVYRLKHGIYVSKIKEADSISTFVHELTHALDNLFYLNNSLPFPANSALAEGWKDTAARFLHEIHKTRIMTHDEEEFNQAVLLFYHGYKEESWMRELAARIIQFKFVYPNSPWPIKSSDLIDFIDKAIIQFINDAEAWCQSFIEESGLNLITAFKENDFFKKNLNVNFSEKEAELINQARKEKLMIVDVVVKAELERGSSLEHICETLVKKDISPYTLLQSAARLKNFRLIKFINENYTLDKNNDGCVKSLHQAVRGGSHEILEYMLFNMDIDPYQKDKFGRDLVSWRAYFNDEIRDVLSEYTIQTSACAAIEVGRNDIAKSLLQGIDVNAYIDREGYPFIIAIESNNIEMFQYILDHCNVDVNNPAMQSNALFYVLEGELPYDSIKMMFEQLLERGIKPNDLDIDGYSIVHKVAKHKILKEEEKIELLELLKQFKADMSIANQEGHLPVHSAVLRHDNLKVIEFLLNECPTDINMPDNSLCTPLHAAVLSQKSLYVQYFLSQPMRSDELKQGEVNDIPAVDVNAKDENGQTALHLAMKSDDEEIIKLLIKRPDCDIDLRDNSGKSAFDYLPADMREEKEKEYRNLKFFFKETKSIQSNFYQKPESPKKDEDEKKVGPQFDFK